MLRRLFIILIISIVSLLILLACSGSGQDNQDSHTMEGENTQTSDTGGESADNITERLQPDLPDNLDFGGDTFTFLVTGPGYGYGYYETKDIYAEEQNGDTINDAVYIRNRNVESKLNINIAEIKSNDVPGDAKTAISAGDTTYDAIFTIMFESAGMAQNRYIMNIKEIPNIDFDKPWWDKNAAKELAIKNRLYFAESDISTMAKSGTIFIVFNKNLIKEYELGDPYEYIRNDKWTLDVYSQMVKSLYVDVNGNGMYDDEDIYGMWAHNHNPMYFLMGFGERMTTTNADGIPDITWNTDRLYSAADKVYDLFYDDRVVRSTDKLKATGDFTNVFGYARAGLFANDKFLFFVGGPGSIIELRSMESDFGLLPMPKMDERQSRYYSPIDPFVTLLSVPVTCEDINKTGTILEVMAAESMYTLRPAYYETLLKRKYLRDSESEFILDIVFDNRSYDLGLLFSWGDLFNRMENMFGAKNRNIVSEMEKITDKMKIAIAKTIDSFE